MIKKLLQKKGQNVAEYAVIFGVVIAAAVGISTLVKEGIQDRVISEVRKLGDDASSSEHLTTFTLDSTADRTRSIDSTRKVAKGGALTEKETATVQLDGEATETYEVGRAYGGD